MLGLSFTVLILAHGQLAASMHDDMVAAPDVSDIWVGDDLGAGLGDDLVVDESEGQDYSFNYPQERPRRPPKTYFQIDLDLFVLPEHFKQPWNELNKNNYSMYRKMSKVFEWMQDFKQIGINVWPKIDVIKLDKDDIYYGHNEKILNATVIFQAMEKSKTIQNSEGSIKMLLIPRHEMNNGTAGISIAGIAGRTTHGDITRMVHYGIAEIPTPNPNIDPENKWLIDWYKNYYNDVIHTKNEVGVLVHELGHLLGATECPDGWPVGGRESWVYDPPSLMCSAGNGTNFGYKAREQIKCRLQDTIYETDHCRRLFNIRRHF